MKSLKLNFFYNVLLNLSKVAFPLVTAPYVARVLEPEGVGLFNFSNTYASYFALFAAIGIPTYGMREISKNRNDTECQSRIVSEILSLSLLTTLCCSVAFFFSLFFIPQLKENFLIFLVAGIILYTTPFKIDWFFSGHEEFGFITFRSLVVKILSVVGLFAFVHKKEDLFIYVLLNAIATVANEIWNFAKIRKYGIHFFFTLKFKKHIKPLLILFSSTIAISIYTALDTVMLGFLSGYSEVAFYNSASHISKSLLSVSISLSDVAIPRLSYYMKNNNWNDINQLIRKSFSIIGFLAFPITIGIVVVAPTFVPLFYGPLYYGAIMPLQIMIFVVLAIGLNNLTGRQILLGLGFDKLTLYAVLGGAVSNFALNLFLIPKYGASGASMASVFAEMIVFVISLYFVKTKTNVLLKGCMREIVLSAVGGLSLIPLGMIMNKYIHGWIFVGAFTFCSLILYIGFQYLVKNTSVRLMLDVIKDKFLNKTMCAKR